MSRVLRTCLVLASMGAVPAVAAAQGGSTTVTGRVVSTEGVGLPSVSVFIEGLNVGSLTRSGGEYTFVVPAARVQNQQVTLTARIIGYKPQSAQITLSPGTVTQNFTLEVNPLQLNEVVITGAGTRTTRERLGNVINSVDSSALVRTDEPNIVQALAGKAPNVEINQQSGDPGASSYIRIRGDKTLTGTGQPLIIVDGVPIDNSTIATGDPTASTVAPNRASDINPADVASVDILKGAAAGAIYGARAGQGVILITTKSGSSGPTRYSLRSTVTMTEVNRRVPLQHRFGQGSDGLFEPCTEVGCSLSSTSFGPEIPAGSPTFDHFDEMFQNGVNTDNDLTISGGNDRTTFYLGAGYLYNRGSIVGPNSDYKKTSVRLKANHHLMERLQVGGNVAYVDARGEFTQKGSNISGIMLGALRTPPDFDNRNWLDTLDDGSTQHRSYRFPNPGPGDLTTNRGYDNPFFVVNRVLSTSSLSRVFGNVNASYDPTDWLNVRYTLGGDYYTDGRLVGTPLSASSFPTGQVDRADFTNYVIDHNLTATAQWTLNDYIDGDVTVGQNLDSRHFKQFLVQGFDLVAPEPFTLDNTVTRTPNEFESLIHSESYFGQVQVNLWDQLYLTGAIRNDGFSTFGESERRHWFPKASAAWTFTDALNEGQPVGNGLLTFGKVRAAFGKAGIEPPVYGTIGGFSTALIGDGGWGPTLSPVYAGNGGLFTSTTQAQPALGPEITREFETGVDLGLLDDRADLSLTYYDSRTTDAIFQLPLPPSTGFTSQLRNAATITNKGFEAMLNVRPITKVGFRWDFGIQYGSNKNRVEDLQGATFVDQGAGTFVGAVGAAVLGSSVGVLRGNDFVRCGRPDIAPDGVSASEVLSACQGQPKGALFIGADGFPVADQTIRVISDPHPNWTGSFRNNFTFFDKLQISALIDVKRGGTVWNGTRGALNNFGTSKETEIRGEKRVFGSTYYPGPVAGPGAGKEVTIDQAWYQNLGSGFGPVSAQFVEDGSYVKLREIAIGYTFDGDWVNRMLGLSTVELNLAGRNLKTWTDYTGIDPETNLGGAEVQVQGVDYFNNPGVRTWVLTLGLNR